MQRLQVGILCHCLRVGSAGGDSLAQPVEGPGMITASGVRRREAVEDFRRFRIRYL